MRTAGNSRVLWAVAIVIVVCSAGLPAQAKYGGGTGEPNDPYQIYTAEQMNAIGAEPNDWDKHFKLTADIDLSAFDSKDSKPAFNIIRRFSGVFDGDNHVIRNLTIDKPNGSDVGLISILEANGRVCNMGLQNVSISGSDCVGGLAGINDGGELAACYATGSVSGYDFVGGLVEIIMDVSLDVTPLSPS